MRGAGREGGARLPMFADSFVYIPFEDGTDLVLRALAQAQHLNQVQSPAAARASLGLTPPASAGSEYVG
jgi:hypothetical protein